MKRVFVILFFVSLIYSKSFDQILIHTKSSIRVSWESPSGHVCYKTVTFGDDMNKVLNQPKICHLESLFNDWINTKSPLHSEDFCVTPTEWKESDMRLLFAGINGLGFSNWTLDIDTYCIKSPVTKKKTLFTFDTFISK